MEMATFENFKKAMESLTIEDDEYVLTRHVLKSGEKIKLHYHPKATEWLIIDHGIGIFEVRVGDEWRGSYCASQATVFLFPKGKKHAIEAITKIEYFVLRDKKDKTVYVK